MKVVIFAMDSSLFLNKKLLISCFFVKLFDLVAGKTEALSL